MRSGVGMKLCHVHPESDTVKRLGHRREKVELLPPGPVWKADFVQERSPHSATGAIWIPQDVFDRFHGTFWRWNGETAQKPESELLLQFQGGQIEGIAAALNEIHLFCLKQLFRNGADGFRSIAVVLVLPADTEGKRPPILSPQRGKSDKGSGNRTDAQIANQTMAVLLHKAVAPWFMIFEPVEILPDVSFRL